MWILLILACGFSPRSHDNLLRLGHEDLREYKLEEAEYVATRDGGEALETEMLTLDPLRMTSVVKVKVKKDFKVRTTCVFYSEDEGVSTDSCFGWERWFDRKFIESY